MCGIAGYVDLSAGERGIANPEWAGRMASALAHRGPDDSGVWRDPDGRAALAHRRLAILDLGAGGHQPMTSACDRYVISFNGEIYNFQALARELQSFGHRFRGSSDTEVMLAAIVQWGLEAALGRFNGMFAFAIWDRIERRLHLARDRFGEKPLYYARMGRSFLFGSELRALLAHPEFDAQIDPSTLALFLQFSCVPAPYSIYRGVSKLPPASWLTVDADRGDVGRPVAYWSARDTAARAAADPFCGTELEAEEELDARLRETVRARMVSDVPLGAFLSGGIDSSAVVAMMQSVSSRPVRTFTIGFDEERFNEAGYAQAVARRLGTEHTELCVTAGEALRVIPRLPSIYDEPFADSSQLPTFLVSQLARRHVTVALTGDGGDELFGGYTRYLWGESIWRFSSALPPGARRWVSRGVQAAAPLLPFTSPFDRGQRLGRLGEVLAAGTQDELYLGLVSQWRHPEGVVHGATGLNLDLAAAASPFADIRERMMLLDSTRYLPDDILVKMDRASMAVSLEARVPFLDPDLFAFAWRLPMPMKIRGRKGKWILRKLLRRYLPDQLIDRPKMGFAAPIDHWLRGALRDWAEPLLDERRLRQDGFFDPAPVRRRWEETLAGAHHGQQYLWSVLMFQAWLDASRAAPSTPVPEPDRMEAR